MIVTLAAIIITLSSHSPASTTCEEMAESLNIKDGVEQFCADLAEGASK